MGEGKSSDNIGQGWSEASHGSDAAPDYDTVFPTDRVLRLNMIIEPEQWNTMQQNMEELAGPFGSLVGDASDAEKHRILIRAHHTLVKGELAEEPEWVPCRLEFEGRTWEHVGVRYKGNSSRFLSWVMGNAKLPLKLDFDKFEDDYPEIKNQRFFGFGKLVLSSNYDDTSLLRERLGSDVFRAAGVPCARTGFAEVYIDYGEGPLYYGLYTLGEVMEDTAIETLFKNSDGNIYKPDGIASTFQLNSFIPELFYKKSNKKKADYSDVEALYDAIHHSSRWSDYDKWYERMETALDLPGFLRWMAVITVAQMWDTYGNSTHNYYLYGDPTSEKLIWLPWDNNEIFKPKDNCHSLSLEEFSRDWPLIKYLMMESHYVDMYQEQVRIVADKAYNPDRMIPIFEDMHALVAPSVSGPLTEREGCTSLKSVEEFEASFQELVDHVNARAEAVEEYLDSYKNSSLTSKLI